MNLKKIGISIIAATAAAMLLSSCSYAKDMPEPRPKEVVLDKDRIEGIWEQVDPETGKPSDKYAGYFSFGTGSTLIQDDGEGYTVESNGNDGCNGMFGTVVITGSTTKGKIEFNQMATTMMFCEGVDTSLSTAQTATYADGKMTVTTTDGKELELRRVADTAAETYEADRNKVTQEREEAALKAAAEKAPEATPTVEEDLTVDEMVDNGMIVQSPVEETPQGETLEISEDDGTTLQVLPTTI